MAPIELTSQQRHAVENTGRSILVSAAAGSGKTGVLAERCAFLVCDAPPALRCNVDELLVLTFTDAAAAEMRSRIVEAIRRRQQARPADERLANQLALIDAARISTIHAFCLWLVRRWFSDIGVGPTAPVLDADEATLLQREVLNALLDGLYAQAGGAGLSDGFTDLVEDYGLGDDREIGKLILKLSAFASSLPDPDGWLREASQSVADHPEVVVLGLVDQLRTELLAQADDCEQTAAALSAGDPVGFFHAEQIGHYAKQLRDWAAPLHGAAPLDGAVPLHGAVMESFDTVRREIAAFEFSKRLGPRLPKDADPVSVAAREAARARLTKVKKSLFRDRLHKRFGLFSVEEWLTGLGQTAPYVATIVELVLAFRQAHAARKRRMDVLDFSDLEQLAFALLSESGDRRRPSHVARTLHRRFAYVLVDEFQDINPIQQAIIELTSRETDPGRPDNLFAVGDVKQSIYRFRMAEPRVFADRLARFRHDATAGAAIFLQSNFRSREEILDAVNLLFRSLMRPGVGDLVYDAEAELHPGRTGPVEADNVHRADLSMERQPVELHVLERSVSADEPEVESAGFSVTDPRHSGLWAPIEREAFLIGSRIRSLIDSGVTGITERALRPRNIVILLRASKVNAERMAVMLSAMGIPAFAEVGGSLFASLEVRDVLSALRVFDNVQQDIPLAAVLRSGIVGEPLNEDDLVAVRCVDRNIPFHAAVRVYTNQGKDHNLRERLRAIVRRIQRYRNAMHRRPLADVLWSLYDQQGYLAYVSGLPLGGQRYANLLKLHDLARKFGSFRRQGLHRFLRFVDSLQDEDQTIGTASALGEADDVVRIMSIHQSKGLEFPVVFVAGLGTRFNLGDRNSSMIFERRGGIGLRVMDTERMIEYPSAAHSLVAHEIETCTREEELRILYVAMTRARQKLVMVGSWRNVEAVAKMAHAVAAGSTPSAFSVLTASAPLEWLLPALAAAPPGCVRGLGCGVCRKPVFDVHFHDAGEIAGWRVDGPTDRHAVAARKAVARCAPLPADEPLAPQDQEVEEVVARLDYVYPALASASIRAAVAASEFKGTYDFRRSPDEREDVSAMQSALAIPGLQYTDFDLPASAREDSLDPQDSARADPRGLQATARRRGAVTHRVLQHIDFAVAANAAGVASELQRLEDNGLISAEDRPLVDQAALHWFGSTPLAEAIRQAGKGYRREFQYIAAEAADYFDRSPGIPPGDTVLVRGIVDGILPSEEGIEIVDFKTDSISAEAVADRAQQYRPQMELYARGMARMWRRPVRACWLVFLRPREIVVWRDIAVDVPG